MSSFELATGRCWGGRPVARHLAGARHRCRVVVTGAIVACREVTIGNSTSWACTLDDGTGTIELVFLGRKAVPGLTPGTRCTVEGTANLASRHLAIWNPRYRIEPVADDR